MQYAGCPANKLSCFRSMEVRLPGDCTAYMALVKLIHFNWIIFTEDELSASADNDLPYISVDLRPLNVWVPVSILNTKARSKAEGVYFNSSRFPSRVYCFWMRNSHDNGRRERIEGWLDGWMNCLSVCGSGFEWVDESVRHLNYTMWLVLEVKHNMWLCVYIGTGGIQGTPLWAPEPSEVECAQLSVHQRWMTLERIKRQMQKHLPVSVLI